MSLLYLNPGSTGPRRFNLPVTAALLWVEESGEITWKIIELERSINHASSSRVCVLISLQGVNLASFGSEIGHNRLLDPVCSCFDPVVANVNPE